MGGWSGGVYTRFRNWATDKANSVNPQATLFDQEDDGFAAGLNNCVTKDGLNKPSSPMDWNGQNLTGVLNFSSTGTLSALNGKLTGIVAGNITLNSPTSGTALTVNSFAGTAAASFKSADGTSTVDMLPGNGAGSYSVVVSADATGGKINTSSSARDLQLQTNSISAFKITIAQRVQILDQSSVFQDTGYLDAPQNLQNANYTFVLADRGKDVHHSSGVAHTWTIPDNSVTAFPVGTVIILTNTGAAAVTIGIPATDALVWVPSGLTTARTLTGFGQAQLLKVAATTWFLTGANVT